MTHQPKLDNPEVAHEPRDVPIGGILYFLLCLVLTIAATMVFLVYLFGFFDNKAAEADPGAPPLASERSGPPSPRLQVSSNADLVTMRAEETKILTSYAWVDEQAQIIRIPIERAMEIVAEQGVPRWSTPGEQQPEGEQPAPQGNAGDQLEPQSTPMGDQPEQSQPAPNDEAPAPSQPAPQEQPQPAEAEVSDGTPAPSPNESEQAQ